MISLIQTKLSQRKDLTETECVTLLNDLPTLEQTQAGEILISLTRKGESILEINSFLNYFKAQIQSLSTDRPTLDVVGTGGDGLNTVNISSAVSLITASLGVPTAKHGNRASSSKCGSADFFEALGIPLTLPQETITSSLKKYNFAFLYAPHFHQKLNAYKALRRSIGAKTIFNLLGPLLNPLKPCHYLLGVYTPTLLEPYANLLLQQSVSRSLIVHSCGLDEMSLLGKSKVVEINSNKYKTYDIDPKQFGMHYCKLTDIQGGGSDLNKKLLLEALSGAKGPIADTLILNSGAALYASHKASTIAEGVLMAQEHLHAGRVIPYLNELMRFYQTLGNNT